jgi:UDP-N-acetylmuramoyl-L-alanyl-D-glutamate--2,6-diaminopimelate ligase
MRLKNLLKGITHIGVSNITNIEINGIKIDTAAVREGDLFVCLRGTNVDSHSLASDAVKNGAVAVITEKHIDINVIQIIVDNSRIALAEAAAAINNYPAKSLRIISVVGTNGKSTTAYLLNKVFRAAGCKTALIGTIEYDILGVKFQSTLTTPDPIELHSMMRRMADAGVEYLFMEISAHSIFFEKVYGIVNKAIIFTNFSQDHLDFFKDMLSYGNVKKSYFNIERGLLGIINIDDALGLEIIRESKMPILSYGINNPADVFAMDISCNEKGLNFTLNMFDIVEKIRTGLSGLFNVYNILAVCTAAGYFGIPLSSIRSVLESDCYVPGRFNITHFNGYSIVIDYAHTEDGLLNLLRSARALCKEKKLITVFGCGGNRDRTKRSKMGAVASEFSDYVIITNDNPRYEEENAIATEIEAGIIADFDSYEIITNRREAIRRAMDLASEGDMVVIAGKGAENYMEISGKKMTYSDSVVLRELIGESR